MKRFWGLKGLLLLGASVGCQYIPRDFFSYYHIAVYIASSIFLFIQALFLVDFAYKLVCVNSTMWTCNAIDVYIFDTI
jgi:hypothetical protein